MKTRSRGSSSKFVKSQKETVPESVPSATPTTPASIHAVSPPTGRRSKTTARKKVLALPGPEGATLIGATSKGVTFSNLDAQQNLASAVPLASSEGQVKSNPALNTSHSQLVSTEAVSDPSEHDSESSLSPNVLTPKAKGNPKSKAAGTKRTKKAKAKINPPPCTSSEDVSPETEDSLPELDPSLTEPIPEVPLEDLEEETESKEDPLETTPVASDPKGTTPLAFPELSTNLTKQKGAPVHTSDDHAPSTARKVKGINLAGSGSGNVASDTPAVLTALASIQIGIASLSERFTHMEDTQRQIFASLAIINASTTPAP
ncbi:uncharacterized protein LOC133806237 [Humulus lupulus]|uniref:uncharacterized protein LOC133806237 n=1 Tax=Humulus lupulus TaxID=3486 RepID=UPI002B40DD20|nr:uncharacterized protein LOC133806237 [Humulus lupulus]